jgi:hypothetical protein
MPKRVHRVLKLAIVVVILLLGPSPRAHAQARRGDDEQLREMLKQWLEGKEVHRPAPGCTENCYVLSSLSLGGAVDESLTFVLKGTLLVPGPTKVPLFGPASQVRLDDVTIDGANPVIGFEEDHYYVVTAARSFTVRGRLTLANDELLTVTGPLVSLDAKLTRGRLVEGEKLSGLSGATLHFDPMTPESKTEAENRTPKVFRLSRAVHIGKETGFVFRLVMSQATDLGVVRLPLSNGERVDEVSGAPGWTTAGNELLLPTTGTSANVTVTGVLTDGAARDGVRSFGADPRSAYEWWLVEADPDYHVEIDGEPKLVENTQSPIPPTLPTARTYLVERGQHLEVEAKSLVRGDVLAAVARLQARFVSVTSRGEVIGDETIAYDNNGLEHLTFTPSGQPIYLSTDGHPGRVLHTEAGSPRMLVPLEIGAHRLRVQTLSETRLSPLAGLLAVPMSDYPLTTSAIEVTLGLPRDVVPIGFFGGDSARWAFARGDGIAALIGVAVACFAFRTRRTRLLGSPATAGLWFVSCGAFVVATAALFFAGAAFLLSRFLRGNLLFAASAAALLLSIFGAQSALTGSANEDSKAGLSVQAPPLPQPESSHPDGRPPSTIELKAGAAPVSLSIPTSEHYVRTSRQLVTSQRPFVPRLLYATPALLTLLQAAWLGAVALLVLAHRGGLGRLFVRLRERLSRRAEPGAENPEALPRW